MQYFSLFRLLIDLADILQLVQAGAVTVTMDGFHANEKARALAQIPIEESDAKAAPS